MLRKVVPFLMMVLLLALAACSTPAAPEKRVVGGVEVSPGEFPWMAQLRYVTYQGTRLDPDKHYCGGSLIDTSWVLTAAHCVRGLTASDFKVDLGEHHRFRNEGREQSIDVAQIIIHPDYNRTTKDKDIALLRLARPAFLNARVNTIDIARVPSANTELTVAGWGHTTEGGASSETLRKAQVSITLAAQCRSAYPGQITDSMFCAGYPEGEIDSCQGDSGGPIFWSNRGQWEQVGLVSWGVGCARANRYGVYTEVADFNAWLIEHIPSRDTQTALAWAWVNESASAPDVYSYPANNSVSRTATGVYSVTMQAVTAPGGTAHVTAYRGAHHCKLQSWGRSGSNTNVNVRCFNAAGAPTNGSFTVLFYRDAPAKSDIGGNAYLWSDKGSGSVNSCYTPDELYQFNSRGGTNQVCYKGTGHYEVRLPQMQRHSLEPNKGGTVQVTAYGTGTERCKVGGWDQVGNALRAQVYCHEGSERKNSRFTFSFMREPGNLASNVAEEKLVAWYVWANTAPTPSLGYQSNTYASPRNSSDATKATMRKTATGTYKVTLPGVKAFNRSTAQLSAYGSGSEYCTLAGWTTNAAVRGTDVNVRCYNSSGSSVDTKFDLLYYSNEGILF